MGPNRALLEMVPAGGVSRFALAGRPGSVWASREPFRGIPLAEMRAIGPRLSKTVQITQNYLARVMPICNK